LELAIAGSAVVAVGDAGVSRWRDDGVEAGVVAAALVGAVLVVCSDGRTVGFVLLLLHPASTTALTRPTVTAAKPREVIRMGGILDDSQAISLLAVHRLHPFSPERPVRH
jgi:hypothetical protein